MMTNQLTITQILKKLWFPIFLPNCKVSKFKVAAWKIAVFGGYQHGKEIVIRQMTTDRTMETTFVELLQDFLTRENFIGYAQASGYKLASETEFELIFEPNTND
jgi:hypothetical protein